jgi:hypothetical protein
MVKYISLLWNYVNIMSADISDAILLISHIAIILKGRTAASLHCNCPSNGNPLILSEICCFQ